MGFTLQAWVEKTVHEVETHWLSGKEKVPGVAISKEGDAISVLGHEGPTTGNLKKGATINRVSCCQLFT